MPYHPYWQGLLLLNSGKPVETMVLRGHLLLSLTANRWAWILSG